MDLHTLKYHHWQQDDSTSSIKFIGAECLNSFLKWLKPNKSYAVLVKLCWCEGKGSLTAFAFTA